LNRCFSWF